MNKLLLTNATLAICLTLSILLQNGVSEENPEIKKLIDIKTVDINEKQIDTRALRGKILIIGVSTEDTSDYMIEWQTEIGFHTGIKLGGYHEIAIISIADVSSFSRFMRPFVRRVSSKALIKKLTNGYWSDLKSIKPNHPMIY